MSQLYDVVIIGGGPMGLSAAYQCAVKENKKVVVIEQFEKFGNEFGSSPGFGRQFRTCYSQRNLCELALKTSKLWDELMKEMKNGTLLDRTGCLWFGDASVHTSEGNINKAVKNLDDLGQKPGVDYRLLEGKEQILSDPELSFISQAVSDIEYPKALVVKDGGTVNVPEVVDCFTEALRRSSLAQTVTNARVTAVDYSDENVIRVRTDVGAEYRCKKVIMTPGTYINDLLATLTPAFPKRINLTIYLWSSTHFREHDTTSVGDSSKWPIWYFFGKEKTPSPGGVTDLNSYYGFPSEPGRPGLLRVAPAYTSSEAFDFEDFPPKKECRPIDTKAMEFTSGFVKKSMPSLCEELTEPKITCVAGFAEPVNPDPEVDDPGFVLDYLPCGNVNKRIVVFTGGWAMKYVPVIGKILADLVLKGETEYASLIESMNINRGILKDAVEPRKIFMKGRPKQTCEQRAAKFKKIWF